MASSNNAATFTVVAKDAASAALRGIGKEMGSLGKTGGAVFKTLAVAAAAVATAITTAAAATLKFTQKAIQAAIADDAEQQKLIATLVTRGATTAQATKRINELIEAGQKLAFTDSEVRAGLNVTSQFTKKYADQQKILTAAMNLARAKNISLEAASKLVGKAFRGNGAALKNYGVDLSTTITKTTQKISVDRNGIETVKESTKAVKEQLKGQAALNKINDQYAGVADAYAKTFAGQFAIVKDSIDEAVESIGYAIGGGEGLPTFVRLLEGIRPVLDDVLGEINDNLPNIQRFSRELVEKFLAKLPGYVATAKRELPILIDKAKEFIGSVSGFAKDLATFLGPDGLITAGIAGLGFKMGGLGGALGATFSAEFIKLGVDPITASITGTLAGAITAGIVQGFASNLAQAAVSKFLGLFKTVPITPSIQTTIPTGAAPAAGGGATGSAAIVGLAAVASSAAAVASIVAIAAVAYSSIVPKSTQAAISKRLGEFGTSAGQAGTATGAGGTYNAGGTYQGGTSSYMRNLTSQTTLKLDGKVVAQSVNRYLAPLYTSATGTRTGGR